VRRPRFGLDTATPFLALALWWPESDRVARASWRLDRRLAAELVPRIDAFLASHGVGPEDLGGVGVGVGPGSYTGARVGVAWALAVGRARSLPVVGGDTLAARALATIEPGAMGWVAAEARRGEAWLQRWAWRAGALEALGERVATPFAELPAAAASSLDRAPDAGWHARAVDVPGAPPPRVSYG
jgi:tRNA threonylcarbamoyl adenosine modification protein YeaZ